MKKILCAFFALLLLAQAFAGTSTDALYNKLQAAYDKLTSFQAAVSQNNYYTQVKKSITYTGNIYFTQGRMLMHFTKPGIQRLLIQNGKVELYDAGSKTVFKSPMQPEFGRMNPVEILQLYWTKSSVTVVSEDKTNATVKLMPAKDDMVNSLSATLNKSSGIVSKLSYTDKSGNSVTYSFSNIKLNGSIPASVWKYEYPKGTQIVEQ
jgi:outer membrane lipoprotein-sorting protein